MINLSPKERERYHELFKKLDSNSDGKIDVNDLVNLFEKIKHKGNDLNLLKIQENNLNRAKV